MTKWGPLFCKFYNILMCLRTSPCRKRMRNIILKHRTQTTHHIIPFIQFPDLLFEPGRCNQVIRIHACHIFVRTRQQSLSQSPAETEIRFVRYDLENRMAGRILFDNGIQFRSQGAVLHQNDFRRQQRLRENTIQSLPEINRRFLVID